MHAAIVLRRSLLIGAFLFVAACASRPIPGVDCSASHGLSSEISIPASLNPSGHYLLLSGGGKWGAFGAGYLNGWHFAAGDALPEFAVVTGVSTGAILATAAFVGEPLPLQVYKRVTDDDIVKPRFFLFAPFAESIGTTEPLREVIESLVDEAALQTVAARSEAGAYLAVGAVSLDSGEFVEISLSEIAKTYVAAQTAAEKMVHYNRYIDAILASSAIPLAMPPVYSDCDMRVDGGLRKQLFWPADPSSGSKVSAVVNGLARVNFLGGAQAFDEVYAKPNLASIAERSIAALLDASLDNDLALLCADGRFDSVFVSAVDQASAEALRDCFEQDNGDFFPQPFMACLYEIGYAEGARFQGAQSAAGLSCDDLG